ADGVVNGIIIDPSGPVIAGAISNPPTSASDSGSGGGGSLGWLALLGMLWVVGRQGRAGLRAASHRSVSVCRRPHRGAHTRQSCGVP
ncbi:MAG TPA: GlyGly-CTERM sorting domain-containing protein, partial [Gammaproteobacteria bacterium]|nr:GlyGly-CTERM sorting domain-containing protein [Gammaproteobacteria bacterium]